MSDKTKTIKKPKKKSDYCYITCKATPELEKQVEQFALQSKRSKTYAGAVLIEKGLEYLRNRQEYSQVSI